MLVADGGTAALEICARTDQPIDMLLTDLVMPGMQGPEVAARATALRPGLKVLLMSGFVQGVLAGSEPTPTDRLEFIEKPFNAETLLTRVRATLDGVSAGGVRG